MWGTRPPAERQAYTRCVNKVPNVAGSMYALQLLGEAGADPDARTPLQQTPLHLAARACADGDFISHLLLQTRDSGAAAGWGADGRPSRVVQVAGEVVDSSPGPSGRPLGVPRRSDSSSSFSEFSDTSSSTYI